MEKCRKLFKKYENLIFPLLLFAVTLAVHMYIGSQQRMLHMSHDEMGVLGCAAYLAGEDWSGIVSDFGYYGYGSSLLYVPIFLITKGPFLRYRLIVALNACIMSLIPVIAYGICVRYLAVSSKKAFAMAAAVGFYPGYLLYSKWAWNETVMCLLPWLMAVLLLWLYNAGNWKKRLLPSVLLAAVLVYSYAVHSRSAALIAAVVLIIAVVLVFKRKLMVEPVSFILTFGGLFLADRQCKSFFMENLWLASDGSSLGNTVGGSMGKLTAYTTGEGFFGLMKIAGGQLSAANASTYGLLIIVLLTLPAIFKGMSRKKSKESDNAWIIYISAVLFFLAAFAISVLFLGEHGSISDTRGDYFIYTRYISNVLGIVILAAFVKLDSQTLGKWHYAAASLLYVLAMLPIYFMESLINKKTSISNTTILNLLAYMGDNPENRVAHADIANLLLICTLVFALAVTAAAGKKNIVLYGGLCCVFLQNYFVTGDKVIVENSDIDSSYVQTAVNALAEVPELYEQYPEIYYYNVHQRKPWSSSAVQFSLPDYHVTEIHLAVDTQSDAEILVSFLPENCLLISTEDLPVDNEFYIRRLDLPYLNQGDDYIWCVGEDIAVYLEENGLTFAD